MSPEILNWLHRTANTNTQLQQFCNLITQQEPTLAEGIQNMLADANMNQANPTKLCLWISEYTQNQNTKNQALQLALQLAQSANLQLIIPPIGSTINYNQHHAFKRIPPQSMNQLDQITKVLRPGISANGQVIQKAEVEIYS